MALVFGAFGTQKKTNDAEPKGLAAEAILRQFCWRFMSPRCLWTLGHLLPGPAGCAQRLNPPPLGRRLKSESHLSVPGRVYPPLPSRRPCTFRRATLPGRVPAGSKSFFFKFFFGRILVAHLNDPKYHFFGKFVDFWSPRRRFSTILGSKTSVRGLLFRCFFFKNGDFVKIVLPLW